MTKKDTYLIGMALFAVLLVLGLWYWDLASDTPATSDQEQTIQITIRTEEEILIDEPVESGSDATLLEIMQQHYDLIVTEEGFIEAIEGVEQNSSEGLYWIYDVNEEQGLEGVKDFIPEDGDHIVWELTAY